MSQYVLPPLPEMLDLRELDRGVFEAPVLEDGRNRTYGGLLAAQALAAASFTVDGADCHSLHLNFLRPGKPGRPVHFEVTALRDARRLAHRSVLGVQREEPIVHMTASFQALDGRSPSYQVDAPDVPPPDACATAEERMAPYRDQLPPEFHAVQWPIEVRPVGDVPWFAPEAQTEPLRAWVKHREALPDFANLHRCTLVYASDHMMIASCMGALDGTPFDPDLRLASLDHSVWFHREFRADEWLLFTTAPVSIADGRGFAESRVFDGQGRLVASVAQEAMVHWEAPQG